MLNQFSSQTPAVWLFVSFVWGDTIYIYASSRGIALDVVPNLDSVSFIRSFLRFISRRGCPNNVISDNGKNFVSVETIRGLYVVLVWIG